MSWRQSPEELFQSMVVSAIESGTMTCFRCHDGYILGGAPELVTEPQPHFRSAAQTCEVCKGTGKTIPDMFTLEAAGSLALGGLISVYPFLTSDDADDREYAMRFLRMVYQHGTEARRRLLERTAGNPAMLERLAYYNSRVLGRIDDPGLPLELFSDDERPAPGGLSSQLTEEEMAVLGLKDDG